MNSILHKNNVAAQRVLRTKPLMLQSKAKPFVQAKLTVNEPGDIYEQEADAMADKVMRSNEVTKPVTGLIGKSLQRKCTHCEEEEKKKKPIMRKVEAGNAGMSVSSAFASSLNASKGGGSALPQGTRSFMENAFSTDFSGVKIHTGSQASEMSGGISAKAFTYGNDIYFNEGQYNTGSSVGKNLLAHELTHVVQQSSGFTGVLQRNTDTEDPDIDTKEILYIKYVNIDKTWCRDSEETGQFHPGQQCYREIPPSDGFASAKQECFDSDTHDYVEPSDDRVSAVCGINDDGTCKIQIPPNPFTKCGMRAIGHGISDICGEDMRFCGGILGKIGYTYPGIQLLNGGVSSFGADKVMMPVLMSSVSSLIFSRLIPAINPTAVKLGFNPTFSLRLAPRLGALSPISLPYVSRIGLGMGYEHRGVSLPLVPVRISMTLGVESDVIFAEGDASGSTLQGNIGLRVDLGRQAGVVLTANRGAGLAFREDLKPVMSTEIGAGVKIADFLSFQLVGTKNDGDEATTYMIKFTGTARKPLPKRKHVE